jgi:ferredoxin-NADP reductase
MYKKFEVVKKVRESRSVISLYLKPADENQLEQFFPGQHLLFKFLIPGHEVPTFRYYSFSDLYNGEYYRISVKKECTPDKDGMRMGLCSSYLFDVVSEGDVLEAKGPSGEFYILPEAMQPLALIAGGIGITPLLSMLKSIATVNHQRELYFFYGVNEQEEHSFQNEINQLKKNLPHLKIYTFYNKVMPDDLIGLHYDYEGLITMKKIQELVVSSGIHYYICGPGGMMTAITTALKSTGVSEENIHTESFNLDVTPIQIEAEEKLHEELAGKSDGLTIEFKRSGKKIQWDHRYRSILEFAEAHDIEITSGCLFGDCGTCLTKVQQGAIQYIHPTTVQPGIGKCLPCSSVPSTDLILEA